MIDYENFPIIAAVKTEKDFSAALKSNVQTIFMLNSNIIEVERYAFEAREAGKILFFHMDFTDGLSKDTAGVDYIATKKIDGIISTRINIIKAAKDNGIFCIQRFFMIDSRSMETTIESRQIKPDMIEIMPGIAYKAIEKIGSVFEIPIIAGGLVEYKDEVYKALAAGAAMVSTGKKEIWDM